MKRILFLIIFLPQLAFSQYKDKCFTLNLSDVVTSKFEKQIFAQNEEVKLNIRSTIAGFSITGKAILENDFDSYIRVVLKDDYNFEYLIYENYPMMSEELYSEFIDTTIETIVLDDIIPRSISIELNNAKLELDSYNYTTVPAAKRNTPKEISSTMKMQQQYIVDRLNNNLKKRNALWRAGTTTVSEICYEDKKSLFGGKVPMLYGLEYYKNGIFTISAKGDGTSKIESNSTHNKSMKSLGNQFVNEWDWRKRHGKNWMTTVKDQTSSCGVCWAFAAVGAVEAYVNLYYNRLIYPNLSEQEIVSCTSVGCNPNYEWRAFNYMINHGIVNEQCFPYNSSAVNCSIKCEVPDSQFFINSYQSISVNDNSIKQALFKNPLTIAIGPWSHSMVLAGYKTIAVGDTIYLGNQPVDFDDLSKNYVVVDNTHHQDFIGKNAWLIKNSWGEGWGDYGFMYVIVNTSNIWRLYSPTGKITSINFDDTDIVCEDADGDGLYFWGIGPKPEGCPSWVPDTPDGDDSNIIYGELDTYGNLQQLPAGLTIKTPVTYTSNSAISLRLGIVNGGKFTITRSTSLSGNGKIRVCEGGILEVNGGVLQNADLELIPGGQVILRNDGKIYMANGKEFNAPQGAIVNIEEGSIN